MGPEVFVSTSILKYEKTIQNYFGSRKATPKMGVGAVVIAKVNEAWRLPHFGVKKRLQNGGRIVCFFEGIAWHSKAEFDNLQAQASF